METLTPIFDNFEDFHKESVIPLQNNNPEFIRLNGQVTSSKRDVEEYFNYSGNKWKVYADIQIDQLTIVYDLHQKGEDKFLIKETLNNTDERLSSKISVSEVTNFVFTSFNKVG